MVTLKCPISQSLLDALTHTSKSTGESVSHIVMRALADTLQVDHATLFQVSTSGALVEGVYKGAVSVGHLLEHGDFGLGTFDQLDGEMIVNNGHCYRVRSDGSVTEASPTDLVPFAIVTHFSPDDTFKIDKVASLVELTQQLDQNRNTQNMFFCLRVEGTFEYLKTRAVCKASTHETLVETAAKQAEFEFHNATGILVGFWTPTYVKTVGIAGYHLHFLSDDLQLGGHLLDCRAQALTVHSEHAGDIRIAFPETDEFLRADLSGDPSAALLKAEH